MRIHELLEACIEYVVVEGVLGADPLVVRAHLRTLDSNVDDAYFAHLWPLLARHECTEVVIAADALPSVNGVIPDGVPLADELQQELFRLLGDDDGGDPPIKTDDLDALLARYPSRVRLRCTEDEIYYRLTGSRKRLAARSREQGISALELGPMTDTTQNSAFHYIKVLVQLGLCAKIPASMHGSSTSVLVYRRFLDENPHYRAYKARDSGEVITRQGTPATQAGEEVDSEAARTYGAAQDLGFSFAPFSELELAAGRIPKERLIRVLDHPGLKNHLLGNHHLLQVVGWPDYNWQVRHRRQLQRHISALIEEGIVEYVDIGTSARACLRLRKYNPDYRPVVKAETNHDEREVAFSVADYEEPFQFHGGALATKSIESQILAAIDDSGLKGCTLADVHKNLSFMFKRTLEHVVNRHDLAYLPPHLRHHAIRCVIESHQRMRRLRVFNSNAYMKYMEQLGQPLNAPPPSEEEGRYADLSFRAFASSPDEYYAETEELAAAIVPVGKVPTGGPRRSLGRVQRKGKAKKEKLPKVIKAAEPVNLSPVKFKYDNDVQERGRPRKYVYIVNEDGSRNRNVVGNLLAGSSLPPVLIYVKDVDVIVEGPSGYTGVGAPPKLTEEQIAAGKPPAYYREMTDVQGPPRGKTAKGKKGKGKGKAKGKGKGKAKAKKEEDEQEVEDVEMEEDELDGEEGNDEKDESAEEDVHMPSSPTAAQSSKRATRTTTQADMEVDQALDDLLGPEESNEAVPAESEAPAEAPESSTQPPTTRKRSRREAASRAMSLISRSSTPSEPATPAPEPEEEPAPKRPRRSLRSSQQQHTIQAPVIDPALETVPARERQVGKPSKLQQEVAIRSMDIDEEMDVDAELATMQSGAASPTPAEAEAPEAEVPEASEAPEAPEALAAEPASSVKGEEEPLQAITDEVKKELSGEKPTPRVVRVDIAVLRRANEIYQCLLDSGRVLSDQKLYIEQKNWSHKYAGTDHPNAPQVGAAMDRKVFKRMVNRLKDDGRLKERIATIPTTTGRWIRVPVLYIADTDETEVQTYIRSLANSTAPPGSPVPTARSKGALEYSAYRRAGPRSSLRMQSSTPQASPAPGTPEERLTRREAYLAEPTMAAYLYGFQSGRCLRAKILHTALVEAFTDGVDSKSVISRHPRVFALPFVFEDLRAKDYFAFVQVRGYDEELYQWLQVPGNLEMRLRDMPPDIAEKAALTGRGSSGAKAMIRTLLSLLAFLQLIMPLMPAEEDEAVVHVGESSGDHIGHFAKATDITTTTYFLLHDVVPIYNIADQALSCLGFTGAKTVPEIDLIWRLIRHASLEPQPPFVRRMDVPPFPYAPDVSGVLDMSIDHPKTLRGRNRWRHEIRLVPEQRKNLDAAIDMTTRQRKVTDKEAVAKLAYDNGLQPSYVEQYLERRIRQLHGAGLNPGRLPSEKAAATRLREREKRQKQKEAIREELASRIRAARRVYDERVRAAAEKAEVEVNQELLDYMTTNRPMSRLGEIASDAELTAIIQSFIRVKSGLAPARRYQAIRPAPTTVRSSVINKRTKRVKNPNVKLRRYRHNWTKEDEELIVDAEAVIRARCRGTNNRGRLAMTQIFPNIGDQVLRTKLKKLLEQPGKEAYYQRLEDAFYHLWVQHRGSAELPDQNPTSHTEFDLKRHIAFLRERVNKTLLKLPVPTATPAATKRAPDLPLEPRDVVTTYEWEYLKSITTSMDQLAESTTAAEDTRLHNVSMASIVWEDPKKYRGDMFPMTRTQGIVRAVLKMIVGTPTELYSTQDAAKVLNTPRSEYEPQIAALVNEQILLKHISGSVRQIPGRMYGFTTQWLQQADNLLPADVEAEVDAAFERFNNPEQTTQWPLIGSGGDLAVLMTMVSNHEAELDVDLTDLPTLRINRLTYNTRALNDDSFEFDFSVTRTTSRTCPRTPLPKPREFPLLVAWPEGTTDATYAQIEAVVEAVRDAGIEGLERGAMSQLPGMTVDTVDAALDALSREFEPRVFWAGYDNACLVAREFWADWSATVVPRQPGRVAPALAASPVPAAPRRWVDIWGDIILSDWHCALKLVVGAITARPGITEASLRSRIGPCLDRLEASDVLQYLVDTGMMTRKLSIPTHRPLPPVHATDNNELSFIVWNANPARLWSPVEK